MVSKLYLMNHNAIKKHAIIISPIIIQIKNEEKTKSIFGSSFQTYTRYTYAGIDNISMIVLDNMK